MGNEISRPLAFVIAAAKKQLPTQGAVSRARVRATNPGIILVDVSFSMWEAAGGETKIQLLRKTLKALAPDPDSVRIVAFSTYPRQVTVGSELPDPSGGTALHIALQYVRRADPPSVLVISDGLPDDPDAAFRAAKALGVEISTIFIGPDSDQDGKAFMRKLASITKGRHQAHDVSVDGGPLLAAIRLALPAPK